MKWPIWISAAMIVWSSLAVVSFAADTPKEASDSSSPSAGVKRALILCGLSGDAVRHKSFAEVTTQLHTALTKSLGFSAENVVVLFGDEPLEGDSETVRSSLRATREQLVQSANSLRESLDPNDSLWVIVLGQSHYDGRFSWLNIAGPDIQQTEFSQLFQGLSAREQVFVITTPTSGFYVKPLSAKGRVVIAATQADWETNETEFPTELARVMTTPPSAADFDADRDGNSTLFDLYVTVARNLAQSYLSRELLATEHALLDDNGDGRGAEAQVDFLTVEQGGRLKPTQVGKLPEASTDGQTDGNLARSILVTLPFAAELPAEAPAESPGSVSP